MQIVLLCGGEGTRLAELTQKTPKSLIKINKKPFLKYLIESILKQNPCSIHFCLGKFSEQYKDFLYKENIPIKITYSIEDENNLLGTGGAIKNAIPFLEDVFILQYGDSILDINYKSLMTHHLKNSKAMTMSILSSDKIGHQPNILCKRDKEGKLQCIYDKKKFKKKGNFIDYGANVFNKRIFMENLPKKFDLSFIQNYLTKTDDCSFYEVSNRFIEIGNRKSLLEAKTLIKDV